MEKGIPHKFTFIMRISDCCLGFVGFGHMAQIIYHGMDSAKLIPRSQVLFIRRDTHKMRENEKTFGITSTSLKNLVEKSQILLLGIRPSQTESVLQELAPFDLKNKLIITIVAGKRLSAYQKYFGPNAQILRVMPNIASSVGEGMSVFSHDPHLSSEYKSIGRLIFSSLGEVIEVGEDLMDISCAIAGSGPGFVFPLIEAMARSGEKAGLSYAEALKISAQVFAGAARLVLKGGLPENLLYQITTPQGTTEAGLKVMQETQMTKHLQMTIEAAANRSQQLH